MIIFIWCKDYWCPSSNNKKKEVCDKSVHAVIWRENSLDQKAAANLLQMDCLQSIK